MTERTETNEEMIERLQTAGETPEAAKIMTELWKRNSGLIRLAVRRATGLSERDGDFEDMTQQAYFGFRSAVYAYDPEQGYKFSTYVVKRIEWDLHRYYERNGYTVHIPAYMKKRLRDAAERKKQLEAEKGCTVSYETALKALNLSPAAISSTLGALHKLETVSLDSTIANDPDGVTLLDMLAADEDVADAAIAQEWHRELHELLIAALQEVAEDIQEIIVRQYFHGVSLRKIAEEKGCTPQTLYNKENAAFQSIRVGKYGKELAEFAPTVSSFERAQRLIKQDREAVERLQLTDTEKGLLIL